MGKQPARPTNGIGRRAWPLLALTLAGLALRVIRWDFQPLWFDEGYSFYFAGQSLGQLLASTSVDIHPPLYYIILKAWLLVFGVDVWPARLLSALIGTLTIPLIYQLGRRLAGQTTALLAAFLLTISPFHVYYSQEVRMYGLVTLFAVLAGLLSVRAFEGRGGTAGWVLAGLALLAGLYTQYYAVFAPAALTVYLLLASTDTRRRIGQWLLTLAGVAVAYLPWLIYAAPRLVAYIQYKVVKDADLPLSIVEFARRTLVALAAGHLEGLPSVWQWATLLPPALILMGLLTVIAQSARRDEHIRTSSVKAGDIRSRVGALYESHIRAEAVSFALAGLFIPWLGAYVINLLAPFNPPRSERLLLFTLPAYCLLGGYVFARLYTPSRLRMLATGILGLVTIGISAVSLVNFYTMPRYPQEDYRPLVALVDARSLPDDAVICVMPWQVGFFEAYLRERRPVLIETPSQIYPQARQFWADDPARMRAELDMLLAKHGRIWLPAYLASGSPLEEMAADYLDECGARTLNRWYGTTRLSLHVLPPAMRPLAERLEFGQKVRLEELSLGREPTAAAYGSLVWAGRLMKAAPFNEEYRLAFRLTDDLGRSWQQWDIEPLAGRRPMSVWEVGESVMVRAGLLLDAGIPPGVYQLRLSVRGKDDVPLQFAPGKDAPPQTEAVFAGVQVTRPSAPVTPAALPIAEKREVELGEDVRLLGYSAGAGPFETGDELKLTLFWQCVNTPRRELVVFAQLLNAAGVPVALTEGPPAYGRFPTTAWLPDDLIRDTHGLRLPASLPEGSYRLIVGMFDLATKERLRPPGRYDYVELRQVTVKSRPHQFNPPTPSRPAQVQFGDLAKLIGYDVAVEGVADGKQLKVTLYWHVLRETDIAYAVFAHVYDAEGRWVGQHDSPPALGEAPTTGWVAGEYVRDLHSIRFEGPAENLQEIWIGLYDAATGRVPLLDEHGGVAGDHFVIPLK